MTKQEKDRLEKKQLAKECFEEGKSLFFDNKLKRAEAMAIRARDLSKEIEDWESYVETVNMLGIIYSASGNDSLEIDNFLDGLDVAIDHHFIRWAVSLFNNIGSKFQVLGAMEQALYNYERAEELAEELEGIDDVSINSLRMILNMNLTELYFVKGEMDKVKKHFALAQAAEKLPGNESFEFSFVSFETLMFWRLGEYDAANNQVERLFELAEKTEFDTDYVQIMGDIVKLFKAMTAYDKWEMAICLMEDKLNEDNGLYLRVEVLKHWLEYYKETENMEAYRQACVDYVEILQQKQSHDDAEKVAAIESKINLRIAEKEKRHSDAIVYKDQLTGIGNRNKMLEDSIVYIEESIAKFEPITVGLVDIDFFKECNDTYGHVDGDECLKKVAGVLRDAVGDRGNVYRYGGDEFLIMINVDMQVSDVEALGKEIKTNLAKLQIPNQKSPVSEYVTVSQGYTLAIAEPGDSIERLVDLADQVLYSVKRYGRNGYRFAKIEDIIAGDI